MIKVYIAAPSELQVSIRHMALHIRKAGIHVTARWIGENFEGQDGREWSVKDLQDVTDADMLVAINPEEFRRSGTGGRHVELGAALILGKPVLLSGARTNVFHDHPLVTQAEDGEDIVEAIQRVYDAKG